MVTLSDLRIEPVVGDGMLEQWRYVHNAIVPPAAMSAEGARERAGRYRLENAYLGDTLVGCSTVRPPHGDDSVATVIARVLPITGGGVSGRLCTRRVLIMRVCSAPG